ncbi:MAG: MFS transporter, partial [Chloroflexota bacterium]
GVVPTCRNVSSRSTKPIKLRLPTQLLSGVGMKAILALLFLHMLSIGTTQLVVPLYSLTLGASPVELGIIVGALGVAGIFFSIPSSVLCDYLARRRMILASFLLWIAAGTVGLLTSSLPLLACVQMLIGLADVCFSVAGITYLTEVSPPGKHAEIQSLSTGLMGLGMFAGPVLGGYVSRVGGFRPVFGLVVLLGTLGVALCYRLPEVKQPIGESGTFLEQLFLQHRSALVLLRENRPARMAILLTLLGTASWMAVGPSFYVVYLNHLSFSLEVIGFLAALRAGAAVLSRFGFFVLAKHAGAAVVPLLGLALSGLTLTMTPFLTSVPILAVVGCLGEGADKLRIPGIYTLIATGTDQNNRSLAVALVNVSWAVTSATVPVVLGLIAERISLSATFLVAGPIAVLSAILLYAWSRQRALEPPRS